MNAALKAAKQAALEVLLHNASGPYDGLPRSSRRRFEGEASSSRSEPEARL